MLTCINVSNSKTGQSVFVLKSCSPITVPRFCISLNDSDKMRLINAPDHFKAIIRMALVTERPYTICREEPDYLTCHQFQLNGKPWDTYNMHNFASKKLIIFPTFRCLMCIILDKLENNGWYLVCSADVSARYKEKDKSTSCPTDVHSWFVVKRENTNNVNPTTSTAGDVRSSEIQSDTNGFGDAPPSYGELFGE